MPAPRRRLVGAVLALALAAVGSTALAAPASAAPSAAGYTVSIGSTGSYAYPDDTPASTYIDKDGTFYFQESHSLYGATDSRQWNFYTGTTFDDATKSTALSNAVNPANSNDKNNDTTWRCNNSPTGLQATYAPSGSSYAQKNYCDLSAVWVDPDTGNWYGLVHNEFTPQPFGDGIHFDAIDYAVSTDQGKTWTIKDHAITSPYSTTRGDNTAFPNQTYYYGDGDQRLLVDTASGYFYVFYGSRIVDKGGSWGDFLEHVARSPISAKMAAGSWQKWYNGAWTEPGVGGRESNMVPVDSTNTTGYTPPSSEYNPANTGTVSQQVAAGQLAPTSPLFVMDVTYDAYLGLYIGEPQAVDQSGKAPQQFYATADLTTQKWQLIGDTGSYTNASWYRWFLDDVNRTGSTIVGKSFRSYCAYGCSNNSSGEYIDVTMNSASPAAPAFDPAKTYQIANGNGRVLAQVSGSTATTSLASGTGSGLEAWAFAGNGDGSYRVINASSGQLLGVDSGSTTGRAWGAGLTVTAPGSGGPGVGQQWFVVPNASGGTYRLVNRYSGLVIGLSAVTGRLAETTPTRSWTDATGNSVGGARSAAEQTLTMTAVGTVSGTVSVSPIASQTWTAGTAVSLQVSASSSTGAPLTYQATGLPAGVSIDPSTGLISGYPSASGSSTATVSATAGMASGSTSFAWNVNPSTSNLNGTHTLVTGGKALDDPGHSKTAGTQLITWAVNGGANQSWQFTQQPDGSYQLVNAESKLCADVSGGSTATGAQVIQWTCTGNSNQHWTVTRLANGAYTVASVRSGLLLTTASTADGSLVTQQANTNSPLQQWTVN